MINVQSMQSLRPSSKCYGESYNLLLLSLLRNYLVPHYIKPLPLFDDMNMVLLLVELSRKSVRILHNT